MNAEAIALLRALIFKMWALNEARENHDFHAIAIAINTWMPLELQITAAHVDLALRGTGPRVTINLAVLRGKIDKMPALYSARINGDYQAILNEVSRDPELSGVTVADVVEAMVLAKVPRPKLVSAGAGKLVGASRIG